jgi:tetratricopeptide (TPR) repeat protein
MKQSSFTSFRYLTLAVVALLLLVGPAKSFAADAGTIVAAPEKSSGTETQDVLRAYLQVQEQLHATQLAIERNRQDAEDVAGRNAIALSERLTSIEKALGEQRSSNHWVLGIAAAIAGLGILAMLVTSFMQMRAMNRFTEIALQLPVNQPPLALGGGSDPRLLGAGGVNGASEANARLISTIERLEKRIREMEAGKPAKPTLTLVGENGAAETTEATGRIETLLGKGQSLLSLGQAEEAAAIFDEALALDPKHTEALIKKGAAMEKLQKLDEAVACYDRAIAADSTVTIAYLYKGGVFNRMERYNEALACYEQALKTQEKAHAA